MGLRIGGITFSGIASGFPTDEIIEQLLELEQRPIDLLEGRKASFEEKLAIFQDLNTRTLTLRDALRKLDNMNLLGTDLSVEEEFRRYAATSSNSTIVTDGIFEMPPVPSRFPGRSSGIPHLESSVNV